MLIVMPVAIKAHLHNVCAKNNYELLIARRSLQEKLRATGLGGEMSARVPRRRDGTQEDGTDPSGRHFHLRVKLFVSELLLFVHTEGEIWDLLP